MKNKATLRSKIYRKLHWFFFLTINPGRWIWNIYPSYLHGKKYAKKNGKTINELVNDKNHKSNVYITQIPNDGAGIGHQMANYNAGVYFSMIFGGKYAHAPFSDKTWDEFLGFGENTPSIKELKKQGYKVLRLPYFKEKSDFAIIKNIVDSYDNEKVILRSDLDQEYKRQCDVIPYIKDKFDSASSRKNDKLIFKADETNVAVHIRRGDITIGQTTGEQTLTKRWLDNDYFEKVLQYVVNEIKPEKPIHIYVFSQGNDDYKFFEQYGKVTLCLDMNAIDSFLHMVKADILVTSKSSFSYKPALLSDGIRICPDNFWHDYPDDDKWIVMKGM